MKKILFIKDNYQTGGLCSWRNNLLPQLKINLNHKIIQKKPSISLITQIKQYDLVHLYEFSLLTIAIVIIAKSLKIPVIATVHGNFIEASKNYYPLKRLLSRQAAIVTLHFSTAITTPSQYMKTILTSLNIDEKKVFVIPNCINLKNFKKTCQIKKRISYKILLVTDFKYPAKARSVDDAIEATRNNIGKKYVLSILGGRGLYRKYKTLSSKNIKFLGIVSRQITNRMMRCADILIHPSYLDNMPMVLLESMAVGLPIITYNKGGIKELVGNSAIISSRKSLARDIENLLSDYDKRKLLSKLSRLRIKKFSSKVISKKYKLLYNLLLDDKSI